MNEIVEFTMNEMPKNFTATQVRFIDGLMELKSVSPKAAGTICRIVHLLHEKNRHMRSLIARFNAGEISAEQLIEEVEARP